MNTARAGKSIAGILAARAAVDRGERVLIVGVNEDSDAGRLARRLLRLAARSGDVVVVPRERPVAFVSFPVVYDELAAFTDREARRMRRFLRKPNRTRSVTRTDFGARFFNLHAGRVIPLTARSSHEGGAAGVGERE